MAGEPRPKIQWCLNNEQIVDFDKYTVTEKEGVCTLIILDATLDMAGKYTVRATNKHGKDDCSAELTVKVRGLYLAKRCPLLGLCSSFILVDFIIFSLEWYSIVGEASKIHGY